MKKMEFLNKNILKIFRKIKNDILQKIHKTNDIDEFSNIHFSNTKFDKMKVLSLAIFTISLVLIIFIFSYIHIKNIILENDVSGSIEPLKIVVAHPEDTINFDNYKTLNYKIKRGDNLANILTKIGITNSDAYDILQSLKQKYDVRKLMENQIVNLKYRTILAQDNKDIVEKLVLDELRIPLSSEKEIMVFRDEQNKYQSRELNKALVKHYMKYNGKIETSLFEDGIKAGISGNIMMEVIKYLSFDVDFQRDIRKGDKFEILFESFYTEEGEKVKDGKILFVSLELRNQEILLYRHKTKSGYDIYFDENGRSIQKSLLKTPINGARISSRFGMRRHPVLGYSRMHKGIDFAARVGTPFFASGNGTIVKIATGWNGGFGNYIKIRHNSTYSTEYAHISRFARGMRVGTKVRQGQVIAYVGNTGRTTGPHLHYGVIFNGQRMNPRKIKSVPSIKLRGNELIAFQSQKKLIDSYRLNTPNQNKQYR